MSKKSDDKLEENRQGIDLGRRGIAKAGVVAPVLMTLSSKSAFGLGRECTPSNLASGNLSSPVDYDTCGGCTPGYWGSAPHADYEGAGRAAGGVEKFKDIFLYTPNTSCTDTAGGALSDCLNVTPFADGDALWQVVDNPVGSTINPDHTVFNAMGNHANWKGMLKELGRQAVAAYLNALHPNVAYSLTPGQVIADFRAAVNAFISAYNGTNGSINKQILEAQKDIFDGLNNQGICPLGNDPKPFSPNGQP